MKIGILTIDDQSSYGNRLQNYALQLFLNSNNYESQSLWWSVNYNLFDKKYFNLKEKIKFILDYHNFQRSISYNYPLQELRKFQIKKFTDKNINTSVVSSLDTINNDYDFFITGSDQNWNPLFWMNKKKYAKAMFLQFTNKEKRVAYASSFGLSNLPKKYEYMFAKYIDSIEHISVREYSAARIIKNLTGRDVPVVLDPTLLISTEHWQSIEEKPEWYDGSKYVLTYFLGQMPETIVTYAKKRNIKLFNINDKSNIKIYSSKLEEFIYLIHHSEMFFTDSFHGSVFAILFKKPFVVLDRQQKGVPNMSSRIDTLWKTFHLTERCHTFIPDQVDFDKIMNTDYSNLDHDLDINRKISRDFIFSSLH